MGVLRDLIIAELDKIAVPTLVLVGADDRHFLAAADYMARKIPGAARVTIPNAGHGPNFPGAVNPPDYLSAAVRWFDEHLRAR